MHGQDRLLTRQPDKEETPEESPLAVEATIGERIRWHRKRFGKSQAALAGLVGHTPNWLYKLERDETPTDRVSVPIELARAPRVRDIADLIGRSFSPSGPGRADDDVQHTPITRPALPTPDHR